MTRYCANCDAEAVVVIERSDTPLCARCRDAYEWGQSNPDGKIVEVK